MLQEQALQEGACKDSKGIAPKKDRKCFYAPPPHTPKKIKKEARSHSPLVDQSCSDSEDSDVSSCRKEGELSEEEEVVITTSQKWLFPTEMYSRMLPKVLRALEILAKVIEEEDQDQEYPAGSERSFPRTNQTPNGVPLPVAVFNVLKA